MKVHVKVTTTEVIEIDTNFSEELDSSKYDPSKDLKWIKFCKDHNFNPYRDYRTRFFDIYLQMCAKKML